MNNLLELNTNEIKNVFGGFVCPRTGCTYKGADHYYSISLDIETSYALYKCTKGDSNVTVICADTFVNGKYIGGFETKTWPPTSYAAVAIGSGIFFGTPVLIFSLIYALSKK